MTYGKRLLFLPIFLTSFVIGIFAYLLITNTQAQESNFDLTVSPVFFDLSVNPGGNVSDSIKVRNNSNSPITVKVEINRLTGDETGSLTINQENSDNSLDWISFEETTYTIRPLESANVPFTIDVPESAAYGYYYTINFTQSGVEETGTTGTSITGSAAVPILLNVRKDGAVAEATLVDFSTSSFINEYLPVNFKVELKNTGNVHIRPKGNIFISGNGRNNVAAIEVNEGQGAIIPNSTRIFDSSWTNGFIVREVKMEGDQAVTDENGVPETKLKINWNQLTDFRFGKYTANLILVYDNGERDVPIEASKTFWVIPYKVIISVIITIIVALFAIRFLLKKYINREVKKRSGSK